MKFCIDGFVQSKAVELELCVADLLILRWFVDFAGTDKMVKRIIEDKEYYWIKYEGVLEDLPILSITKDTLYRRLKSLVEKEVLEHLTVKEGGTYSFYRLGKNYLTLIADNSIQLSEKNPTGYGKKSERGTEKNPYQKTNLLNNKSTKDKENVEQSSTIPYSDIINYLNKKAGTDFRSTSKDNQKHISARWNEGYKLEDFFLVIDIKVSEWKNDTKMYPYLRPSTLFGTKFESYLQQAVRCKNGGQPKKYKDEAISKPVEGETLEKF